MSEKRFRSGFRRPALSDRNVQMVSPFLRMCQIILAQLQRVYVCSVHERLSNWNLASFSIKFGVESMKTKAKEKNGTFVHLQLYIVIFVILCLNSILIKSAFLNDVQVENKLLYRIPLNNYCFLVCVCKANIAIQYA